MLWSAIFVFLSITTSLSAQEPAEPVALEWQIAAEHRSGLVWNAAGPPGRALVIVLHGGSRTPQDVASLTRWPQTADRHDFVLIAPEGLNRQWNDGRTLTASGEVSTADDVAFIDTVIAQAIQDQGVDPERVYLTGVSNGGLMSFRFACERPNRLAAVAPSLAKLPHAVANACESIALPSLLLIAGTADPAMAFDGEPAQPFRAGLGTQVLMTVPTTLRFWRDQLGCGTGEAVDHLPDLTASDRSTALHFRSVGCPSDNAVEALILDGGGHREPTISNCGSSLPPAFRWLGAQNCDVETSEFVWDFFSGHARTRPIH